MTRLLLIALLVFPALAGEEPAVSAFRLGQDKRVKHSVDLSEVKRGIPRENPRDLIPSIDKPQAIPAELAAGWLRDDDRVLGIVIQGQARAYPLRVLVRHEVANDLLGGVPIAASY